MPDCYWYLNDCPLFRQLSAEDIRWLEARCRTRKLARGELVYLPADAADGVLLVAAGRIRIYHVTPEGKQSILGYVDRGEIFGELALIDVDHRDEYAEAAEASMLVLVPRDGMLQLMNRYPVVSLGVTKLIGMRRQRIERRLRNLLFRTNRERLVHLLLELMQRYSQTCPEGVRLTIRLSHQEIANIIGSTRETVTNTLGQLQREQLIDIQRRRIVITDAARLQVEVESDRESPPDAGDGRPAKSRHNKTDRITASNNSTDAVADYTDGVDGARRPIRKNKKVW